MYEQALVVTDTYIVKHLMLYETVAYTQAYNELNPLGPSWTKPTAVAHQEEKADDIHLCDPTEYNSMKCTYK